MFEDQGYQQVLCFPQDFTFYNENQWSGSLNELPECFCSNKIFKKIKEIHYHLTIHFVVVCLSSHSWSPSFANQIQIRANSWKIHFFISARIWRLLPISLTCFFYRKSNHNKTPSSVCTLLLIHNRRDENNNLCCISCQHIQVKMMCRIGKMKKGYRYNALIRENLAHFMFYYNSNLSLFLMSQWVWISTFLSIPLELNNIYFWVNAKYVDNENHTSNINNS